MNGRARATTILCLLVVGGWAVHADADCAPFYDSLNNLASIAANGGSVSGTVQFVAAVNGNGAAWGASGHLTYSARGFRTPAGALSLWYKKTTAAASGGICQIGVLGQANSIGLFYVNGSDLCFELRDSASNYAQTYTAGVISQTQWVHIVAAWQEHDGTCDMWLFINGTYRNYASLPGTFSHTAAALQVGTTGYYGHGQGTADELRWFDWSLQDSEAYAEYVYSSNRFRRQAVSKPVSTGPVQIIEDCLYVNGARFHIKGVGYAPTPIGYWGYSSYTDPGIIARDVPLLKGMHINTVRTWSQPPNSMLLDALYYNGDAPIYMIVGFWVPISGLDYGDPATIVYYEDQFRSLVNQFKNHPGVLAWGIGNEVNLSLSGQDLANWYALANLLAQTAYEAEGATYHPCILVNGGLMNLGNVECQSDDVSLSYVDVWGQNTYFGWDAHCFFDYYGRLSAKPLVFTEFGIDAWNNQSSVEYPDVQAAWEVRQWRQIRAACLGGTVMAYSDEWWKADDPNHQDFGGYGTGAHPDGYSNEEWWGVVWVQNNGTAPDIVHPRQSYYALGQEYGYDPGDADGDDDVDLADFAAFQACFGSSTSGTCGSAFDYVASDVIDIADFDRFVVRLNGPGRSPTGCP